MAGVPIDYSSLLLFFQTKKNPIKAHFSFTNNEIPNPQSLISENPNPEKVKNKKMKNSQAQKQSKHKSTHSKTHTIHTPYALKFRKKIIPLICYDKVPKPIYLHFLHQSAYLTVREKSLRS